MTPAEKAKHLVRLFGKLAIYVVDEILQCDAINHASHTDTIDEKKYWLQVRKIIMKP